MGGTQKSHCPFQLHSPEWDGRGPQVAKALHRGRHCPGLCDSQFAVITCSWVRSHPQQWGKTVLGLPHLLCLVKATLCHMTPRRVATRCRVTSTRVATLCHVTLRRVAVQPADTCQAPCYIGRTRKHKPSTQHIGRSVTIQ